jgi:Tfp pilus assembly protein PilO
MLKNLSPRERQLALALGMVVFLIINLVFVPQLIGFNRTGKQKNAELKAQLQAAEGWVARKAYWNTRKDWLEKTTPSLNTARQDSANQLELLQKTAREFGLQITDINLLQLDPTEYYQPVGARLTVQGPWSGLVQFVSGLQNPELFDVIPRFSVKSADPPPNVTCELEIQRWFHLPPTTDP